MEVRLPRQFSFVGIALFALGAAACGARPEPAASPAGGPSDAAAGPRHGGVLRIAGTAEPPHLDPFDTPSAGFHTQGPGTVYSRLLRYEHRPGLPSLAYTPGPDLAERWEQTDPTTYVFHLRTGVKFQNLPPVNGREVTAEDVLYSYNRQREAGRPNAGQFASVAAITAPDKYTVRITLKQANPDFLVELADGHNQVVPRETVELNGHLKNGPNIGSGPWILEKFEKGAGSSYRRNPDYFQQPLPYLDRVEVYTNFSDATARIAAFRTGRLDILEGIGPQDRDSVVKANPKVLVQDDLRPTTQILSLKQDRPPFNDVRVRQAVSKAIDREQVRQAAWGGQGWIHAGVNVGGDHFLPEAELKQRYQRDVAGARRLLAEAGHANGLEFEVLLGPNRPEDTTSAELLVAQLREAGITARLSVLDYARYVQQVLTRGEFTAAAYGNYSSLPTPNAVLNGLFNTGSTRNINAVKDPELERMIAEQGREPDKAKRKAKIQDIQRYVLDQALLIVVHANTEIAMLQPQVRDWYPWLGYDHIKYAYVWFDNR